MAKTLSKENFLVGNEVTFGRYKQDADSDDMREIQWIVLAKNGEKTLLISKYGLDINSYHSVFGKVTWEESDVRNWLNTDFINAAFSKNEQKAILLTQVDNSLEQGYSGYGVDGGNDTEDKVFLLSYKEAFEEYFVDDESRICKSTAYALKCGAYEDETGNCWWWLRSPGYDQFYAACVCSDGSCSNNFIDYDCDCIRPALWIDLDSDIFRRNAQD